MKSSAPPRTTFALFPLPLSLPRFGWFGWLVASDEYKKPIALSPPRARSRRSTVGGSIHLHKNVPVQVRHSCQGGGSRGGGIPVLSVAVV